MTLHQVRCIIVAIEARFPALGTWYASNVDPNDDGSQWPRLVLVSDGSAWGRWRNTSLTMADFRLIVTLLCVLASITFPADWDSRTVAQKLTWLLGQRAAIFSATGIWIQPFRNDTDWDDAQAVLAVRGLRVAEGGE